jgi:hypothetical protein
MIPVPDIVSRVVGDLASSIRRNRALLEKTELFLNGYAITITKRKVSVDETEVFPILIAYREISGKQFPRYQTGAEVLILPERMASICRKSLSSSSAD